MLSDEGGHGYVADSQTAHAHNGARQSCPSRVHDAQGQASREPQQGELVKLLRHVL